MASHAERPAGGWFELLMRGVAETLVVGECIGRWVEAGDVLALVGPLGAGKTWLTKGIAKGLGVEAEVSSPTFILVNEYEGRLRLYHIDAYRMAGADDVLALGWDEMISSGGVTAVEWADRMAEALPEGHVEIVLEHAGPHARKIKLAVGRQERISALSATLASVMSMTKQSDDEAER